MLLTGIKSGRESSAEVSVLRVYRDEDGDLKEIANEPIAVIGYGIQGRAQALNLRDSGLTVCVGNRADDYADRARQDGFEVLDIAEATSRAAIVLLLVPDEAQPDIFAQQMKDQGSGIGSDRSGRSNRSSPSRSIRRAGAAEPE